MRAVAIVGSDSIKTLNALNKFLKVHNCDFFSEQEQAFLSRRAPLFGIVFEDELKTFLLLTKVACSENFSFLAVTGKKNLAVLGRNPRNDF